MSAMKKLTGLLLLSLCLVLPACKKPEEDPVPTGTEYGPIVEEDERTDEEKQLAMIQNCISDYNTGRISEVEDYLDTTLHPLPIGVTSLPEISSLKDLTPEPDYMENSNVSYAGSYAIDDVHRTVFLIYEPTGGSFWLNGVILFQVNPEEILVDNPEFTDYRNVLSSLFAKETKVLPWLYGLNLTLSETESSERGYYEVLSMGGMKPSSIDDIKAQAEEVFTKDYLENNFYYSAFYNEHAMFKEIDGKVCCAESEMTIQPSANSYNVHYIIAAEEAEDKVSLDILTNSNTGEIQPNIRRLYLAKTPEGYRLPSAY